MVTKKLTAEEKLMYTSRLVLFLEGQLGAGDDSLDARVELLMLAYHASTSTDYFKRSLLSNS